MSDEDTVAAEAGGETQRCYGEGVEGGSYVVRSQKLKTEKKR